MSFPLPDQTSGQGNPVGNASGIPNPIINPDYSELLPLVDQPTAEYQIPSTQEQYQSLDNLYYQLPNNNFYDSLEQQTPAEQSLFNDDYYMPSSLNNAIVESSINEYHHYYRTKTISNCFMVF